MRRTTRERLADALNERFADKLAEGHRFLPTDLQQNTPRMIHYEGCASWYAYSAGPSGPGGMAQALHIYCYGRMGDCLRYGFVVVQEDVGGIEICDKGMLA